MRLLAAALFGQYALSYEIVNDARANLQFLRVRRKNKGFFEETRSGDYERECIEEMCSKEELNEIYDGQQLVNTGGGEQNQDDAWKGLTQRCYVDKCNPQGTQICIQRWNERTCVCKTGWEHEVCDQDIDECTFTGEMKVCLGNRMTCSNTQGSYECGCQASYKKDDNGVCVWDSTTCADTPCGENNSCTDSVDEGYTCSCLPGYAHDDGGFNCEDINECESIDICSSTANSHCANNVGSYTCECDAGFESLNGSCEEIPKCRNVECDANSYCDHLDGVCYCNQGFKTSGDGTCVDIDECVEGLFGFGAVACIGKRCVNEIGTHTCEEHIVDGPANGPDTPTTTERATTTVDHTDPVVTKTEPAPVETTEEIVNNRCSVDVDECQVNNGGCESMCMNFFCYHKCYEEIPEEAQMCHHFAAIEEASEENDMRGYTCGCYEPYEICIDQFSCVPREGSAGYDNGRFIFNGDTSSKCESTQIGIADKCYSISSGKASYGGALEACSELGGALVNLQGRKAWWVLGNSIDYGSSSFWVDSASDADMNVFGSGNGRLANPARDMSNVPPQLDNADPSEQHKYVCEF